jgi:hypothetical protein
MDERARHLGRRHGIDASLPSSRSTSTSTDLPGWVHTVYLQYQLASSNNVCVFKKKGRMCFYLCLILAVMSCLVADVLVLCYCVRPHWLI